MLPGTLVWKINSRRFRNRIYEESVKFLLSLNRSLRIQVRMEDEELDQLFVDELRRLAKCPSINSSFRNGLKKVITRVSHLLLRRTVFLSPSHGDYGYGNILVDPNSGRLTGVIDWDTGRKRELIGVDFLRESVIDS